MSAAAQLLCDNRRVVVPKPVVHAQTSHADIVMVCRHIHAAGGGKEAGAGQGKRIGAPAVKVIEKVFSPHRPPRGNHPLVARPDNKSRFDGGEAAGSCLIKETRKSVGIDHGAGRNFLPSSAAGDISQPWSPGRTKAAANTG